MAHADDQRVARVLDALEAQHPARSYSQTTRRSTT